MANWERSAHASAIEKSGPRETGGEETYVVMKVLGGPEHPAARGSQSIQAVQREM